MTNEEYRTIEITLLNRLTTLCRGLKKVKLSQLEEESLRLTTIGEELCKYWAETASREKLMTKK